MWILRGERKGRNSHISSLASSIWMGEGGREGGGRREEGREGGREGGGEGGGRRGREG